MLRWAAMTTAAQLRNRVALVTGGSAGIGAAIAMALAREGAHLVLVARDPARLDDTAAAIRSRYDVTVRTIPLDLASAGAASDLLDRLRDADVEIELLVNSAAIVSRARVADTDPAALRRLVDVNVGALVELSSAMAAEMVERGHGSIVNIASLSAYAPGPLLAGYSASKAFVLAFTRSLWAETRDRGIRVVAVSPGPTTTAMNPNPGRGRRRPDQVADTVLAALSGSAPTVVDGRRNLLTAAIMRALPASVMAGVALRRQARAQG